MQTSPGHLLRRFNSSSREKGGGQINETYGCLDDAVATCNPKPTHDQRSPYPVVVEGGFRSCNRHAIVGCENDERIFAYSVFVQQGENIKIDTRTGEYVARA